MQHGRKDINLDLKKESEYFGDIVIVPYMDTYDLVVLKTVAICEYGVSCRAAIIFRINTWSMFLYLSEIVIVLPFNVLIPCEGKKFVLLKLVAVYRSTQWPQSIS